MATDPLPPGIDWRKFTPEDSPKTPMDVISDPGHQDLATPKLASGDAAFDFTLPVFDFSDGTERETDEVFHLLEVAETKPVALIFGSYT